MAMGRILVVAPSSALRRSIAFALEAEGHDVVVLPHWREPMGADFDLCVLDDKALSKTRAERPALPVWPVILLAERAHNTLPWLSARIVAVLEKPMLGDALSSAVQLALTLALPGRGPLGIHPT